MIEVRKKDKETTESLMRRFSRKIQQSGVLVRARRTRFRNDEKSKTEKRTEALYKVKIRKEIDKLKSEKDYYKSEINQDRDFINKHNDREELEKFAREQYKMKKESEEIYIIEYDTIPEE